MSSRFGGLLLQSVALEIGANEDLGSYDEAFFDNLSPLDGYLDLVCHFLCGPILL